MSNTSIESVWVKNPSGVAVALPPHLAAERLKQVGYSLCEAEYVPAKKVYPLDGELTEQGEKRREHRAARAEAEAKVEASAPEAEPESAQTPGRLFGRMELETMPWLELVKFAQMRGINTKEKGMTKEKVMSLLLPEGM